MGNHPFLRFVAMTICAMPMPQRFGIEHLRETVKIRRPRAAEIGIRMKKRKCDERWVPIYRQAPK
jgi:hypothetical protein